MKNAWKGMLALGTAAALALPAVALEGGPGRRGPRGPRDGGRLAEFVGLTDEQKAAWQQMHEEFRAAQKPQHEAMRGAHEKLRTLIGSEDADATAVGQTMLSLHKQRQELKAQHEAFQQRLRGTLTPEQQVKYDAFRASHPRRQRGPGRHGFGHGKLGPRPDGPDAPEDVDAPEPF